MTLEIVLGLIRHLFTAGGGVLIAKGLADPGQAEELSGAVVFLVGFVWSAYRKLKRGKETPTTPPAK